MSNQLEQRLQRARGAKRVIFALANNGPRFLYDRSSDRIAQLSPDRYGQTWYVDAFSGMMMYPFPGQAWNGYTAGPQLQPVIMALASYVRDGHQVDLALIERACAEPYGKDWELVRAILVDLEEVITTKRM